MFQWFLLFTVEVSLKWYVEFIRIWVITNTKKKNKVPQIVEMKTNMNLQHFLSFFGIYGKFYFWKRVYVFLNLNFLFTMNSKLTMSSYIWKHTLWHWCDKIQNGTYFMLRNPLHGWLITLGMRWWSYKKNVLTRHVVNFI